jgi:hypothetical protein
MNIALLFNSDHPSLGGCYSLSVMERILATGALQKANRNIRVSVGDILTHLALASRIQNSSELVKLCQSVYQPRIFDRLIRDRLEFTHGKATVFCWVFQNITIEIAENLNNKLVQDPAYLGAMDIDFSDLIQLRFFRNSLPETYRLNGNRCSVFYALGENEDPDMVVREIFRRHEFIVEDEDAGARGTIFDEYDSIDHFTRIEDAKRVLEALPNLTADFISDLVLVVEDLHPKLFNAFASAARTLDRAETDEDFAQVALSGRRLMEQVADYLFPARGGEWNGRKIGPAEYKNRLWTYIEQAIKEERSTDIVLLSTLGDEVDRLVKLFNSGLHAVPSRESVRTAFSDLLIWLKRVIDLSPKLARNAYLAYESTMVDFLRELPRQ